MYSIECLVCKNTLQNLKALKGCHSSVILPWVSQTSQIAFKGLYIIGGWINERQEKMCRLENAKTWVKHSKFGL